MKKLVLIIASSLLIILIGVWVISLQSSNKSSVTVNDQSIIPSVDFYSADLPQSARQALYNWLLQNAGFTAKDAATSVVRSGSFKKTYNASSTTTHRDFLLDSKVKNITYEVKYESSLDDVYNPLYIVCPAVDKQMGNPADCRGMTQL